MNEIEQLHLEVQSAAKGFGGFVSAYDKGLRAVSRGDRVPYDWQSPSQTVRRFLNGDFHHLCQSLELLKTIDCDEYAGQFAQTLSDTMLRLGEVTASEWKRFGVVLRRDFTWSAQILLAVFKPRSFRSKRMPRAFAGRVAPDAFRRQVMDAFVTAYCAGLTPNPCIVCNRALKFGTFLDRALDMGYDYIATGHYARVVQNEATGLYELHRAADRSKDQTYVLYQLTQHQLSHLLLPCGDFDKPTLRQLAENAGLLNAQKKDSQDICFIPDGDYKNYKTGKSCYVDLNGKIIYECDFDFNILNVAGTVNNLEI